MVRQLLVLAGPLFAALLTAGASPGPNLELAVVDPIRPLTAFAPAPGQSAATPGGAAFTPAPMPDPDMGRSFKLKPGPQEAKVSPSFFQARKSTVGDGYTPYSTVDTEQTKRMRPTPTLNLSVPLQ
jgi:hypothetical protein